MSKKDEWDYVEEGENVFTARRFVDGAYQEISASTKDDVKAATALWDERYDQRARGRQEQIDREIAEKELEKKRLAGEEPPVHALNRIDMMDSVDDETKEALKEHQLRDQQLATLVGS